MLLAKIGQESQSFILKCGIFQKAGRGSFADGVRVDSLAILDEAQRRVRQEGRYLGRGEVYGYKRHGQDYEIESWKVGRGVVVSEVLRDEREEAGMPKRVIKIFCKSKGKIREIGMILGLPIKHIPEEAARRPLVDTITEILNS